MKKRKDYNRYGKSHLRHQHLRQTEPERKNSSSDDKNDESTNRQGLMKVYLPNNLMNLDAGLGAKLEIE